MKDLPSDHYFAFTPFRCYGEIVNNLYYNGHKVNERFIGSCGSSYVGVKCVDSVKNLLPFMQISCIILISLSLSSY